MAKLFVNGNAIISPTVISSILKIKIDIECPKFNIRKLIPNKAILQVTIRILFNIFCSMVCIKGISSKNIKKFAVPIQTPI